MEKKPTILTVVAAALPNGEGAAGQGKWLMHRRPAGKHHAGLWEFPGGKIEGHETPQEALCREIVEEIDLTLDPEALEHVGTATSPAQDGHPAIAIDLFIARQWKGIPRSLEGGAIEWFAPKQIDQLDKPPLDIELARQLFAASG